MSKRQLAKIDVELTEDDVITMLSATAYTDETKTTPRDLTGATIKLKVRRPSGTPQVLELTATPIDLSVGTYKFDTVAGNLVPGSDQLCQIQTKPSGGGVETSEDFLIDVKSRLGT